MQESGERKMTEKRFTLKKNTGTDECHLDNLFDDNTFVGAINSNGSELICYLLNTLYEEKEYLKTRFHEERELAMRLSRECDALTIKKQELELEIIRLETIIRTGKKENSGND